MNADKGNNNQPQIHADKRGYGANSFFGRLIGSIAFAGLLVVGFMFSLVVFSILLVAGLIAGGYWWWKTRDLRRQLREQMERMAEDQAGGRVIEGEVIRDPDHANERKEIP